MVLPSLFSNYIKGKEKSGFEMNFFVKKFA